MKKIGTNHKKLQISQRSHGQGFYPEGVVSSSPALAEQHDLAASLRWARGQKEDYPEGVMPMIPAHREGAQPLQGCLPSVIQPTVDHPKPAGVSTVGWRSQPLRG